MEAIALKIGEIAKQTGVSTRTLHYYDQIGLLSPAHRTDAGYRLYDQSAVIRLQQIMSLRQLGFSLEQIQDCLSKQSQFSPESVVQLHLTQLKEQIALQQKLCERLEAVSTRLQSIEQDRSRTTETIAIEEFIQVIEAITMIEKYYTPEQLDSLKARATSVGEARIKEVEAEWPVLIAQARTAMENGVDPLSEAVQALARRWQALVQEFTGGDEEMVRSLNTMYQQEGAEAASQGEADSAVMEYMGRALSNLSDN